MGDVTVTLAPIVVYSDKIFRISDSHLRSGAPLGLAIDLGSTTVAAFVSTLDEPTVKYAWARPRSISRLRSAPT